MTRDEFGEVCQHFLDRNGVQHFSPYEIADVGRRKESVRLQAPPMLMLDNTLPLIRVLEWLRERETTAPVLINSWYRDPYYNSAVGGVTNSMHLILGAADITKVGFSPQQVAGMLESHPEAQTFGIGCYNSFVHLDIRGHLRRKAPARW